MSVYTKETLRTRLLELNEQLKDCTSDFSYWQIIHDIQIYETLLEEVISHGEEKDKESTYHPYHD